MRLALAVLLLTACEAADGQGLVKNEGLWQSREVDISPGDSQYLGQTCAPATPHRVSSACVVAPGMREEVPHAGWDPETSWACAAWNTGAEPATLTLWMACE